MPWPSAPIVTAASPVSTPALACSTGSSSGTAATRSSAVRTHPLDRGRFREVDLDDVAAAAGLGRLDIRRGANPGRR